MDINDPVFQAILSMDSYNRGYKAGLVIGTNQVGKATVGLTDGGDQAEAKPPLMQILRAQRNEPVGPGFVPDVSDFSRGGVT